jgi:hypothetical protein
MPEDLAFVLLRSKKAPVDRGKHERLNVAPSSLKSVRVGYPRYKHVIVDGPLYGDDVGNHLAEKCNVTRLIGEQLIQLP